MASDYLWSETFSDYLRSMRWGQGYPGEAYWQEEEDALLELFGARPAARTLSVGCGLFRELETLKRITREEIMGLDLEPSFVAYSSAFAQTEIRPFVSVVQGDALSMNFERPFDLIASLFNGIGFLPDMPLALRRMQANLAPGGRIIVSVWQDTPSVTELRMRIYTSSDNKEARVITDDATGLEKISCTQGGKEVFSSLIFTKPFLERLVRNALGDVQVQWLDSLHCRLMFLENINF